jgi:hypothetical protein
VIGHNNTRYIKEIVAGKELNVFYRDILCNTRISEIIFLNIWRMNTNELPCFKIVIRNKINIVVSTLPCYSNAAALCYVIHSVEASSHGRTRLSTMLVAMSELRQQVPPAPQWPQEKADGGGMDKVLEICSGILWHVLKRWSALFNNYWNYKSELPQPASPLLK